MLTHILIWLCVLIFLITAVITILGIIESPKIISIKDQWLKPLYTALILEIVVIGISPFRSLIFPNKEVLSAQGFPQLIESTKHISNNNRDFFRMFFLKDGSQFSGKLGNYNAERVFVSPSRMFESPLSLGEVASYLGNDYRESEDVYLLKCNPTDYRVLDPVLATWSDVFALILRDFPKPKDCTSVSSNENMASCIAEKYSKLLPNKNALLTLVDMYKSAEEMLNSGLEPFLKTKYGISASSYIGTGHTVSGSGVRSHFSAVELLKSSNIPEFLVKNVPLKDGACKCIIVTPYEERQHDKFSINIFSKVEKTGMCQKMESLPDISVYPKL